MATKRSNSYTTTLKLPRSLQERMERLRKIMPKGLELNASAVCREALEQRVAKLEKEYGRGR